MMRNQARFNLTATWRHALVALLLSVPICAHAKDGAPDEPRMVPPAPESMTELGAGETPSSRAEIRKIIERETAKTGLPADIAEAVVFVESGYNPAVIGSVGEIGLMQVRPETASMLGFRGNTTELAEPDINIHYGVLYQPRLAPRGRRSLPRLDEISGRSWRRDDDRALASLLQPRPQPPARHELGGSRSQGRDRSGSGSLGFRKAGEPAKDRGAAQSGLCPLSSRHGRSQPRLLGRT